MKLSAALTASLLALPAASAFAPMAASRGEASPRMASSLKMASSLAANQQKAAAIRAAEARNQAEIEALKAQIAQIESAFANPSTFPTLPADVSSLNSNQLQGKLGEVKSYLGTLLQRSEDNQRQVAALTGGETKFDVKLVQMVHLMRDGEPVKMSKRSGNSFCNTASMSEALGCMMKARRG